ncbi:MAG: lipopolysaccharide kinase InaA family protein [Candidatus Scalindua sp.]|jgi:tRNA A-37 threonylcarbamoyl transferase component Bud32|nr:lipopolysaccharide kinase InaA family protein [Candidatus Scalindua sp.]MDV5165590.1 lipopolysaccharide kinase InaA family protein [Candidatus Scalindua sp.]
MKKTTKNGTEWTVRDGYENIPDMFNPDDLLSDLNGQNHTLVKENRVRSVISMPGSDISKNGIYIKYFKRGGCCEYIKHLFVPTKARTEWEVGNALLTKDVNTALPLAISEGKRRLLIVTETVTNSEELMEFCHSNYEGSVSAEKESEKRILLDKLALFIRDIHGKGFCHYDLHAGNILIRFKDKQNVAGYDLYLMDLHRVKIFQSISVRQRLFNLAQIFNSLSSIMTNADKLDFVRSYGSNALGNITDEKELAKQIDEQSAVIRNIHYRSRLKRCLKESSVFSRKKIANMKMFFRKGYDTDNLRELIEKHNIALVNNDSAVIMKRDSKTALTRRTFNNKTVQNVVVKQYRVSCPGCLVKNIFRGSAGRKAWVAGNGLRVYGLNTPLPLALIEKKIAGITTGSYLIMEEVKDSLEMDRYILKNFSNRNDLKKKSELIRAFAKILGEMHSHNIFHHDLKTCNIMVKEKGKSFGFTFLDFDNVSFNENIAVSKRVKNLIQINLSTPRLFTLADRLRFLKEYLDQCGITNEEKNILRDVINLSKAEKILYVSSQGDVTEDW